MSKIKTNFEVIQALKAWNIDHVYGIPGDSIDAVIDGLKAAEDEIDFYHVRHEEVASLTAAAYSKLTGKIGVALSIGGPGAIHMLNGMYDAKMDRVPQLILAGQVDSDAIGTKGFQEVNLPKIFEDVAVYNRQIKENDNIFDIVNEAIRTAYEEKGVAVLTLPNNLLATKTKSKGDWSVDTTPTEVVKAEDSSIHAAKNLLEKSEKPVMLIGVGTSTAKDEVREFIEKVKVPTIFTLPAKGILPDSHPYNIGNLGKIGTKPAFNAMKNADLLILAGTNYPYTAYLPDKDISCIQIDIDKSVMNHRFNVDVPLLGDSKDIFGKLRDSIDEVKSREFLDDVLKQKKTWDEWMEEDMADEGEPIRPERLMSVINDKTNVDTIFSSDVGTSTVWSTRYLNLGVLNKFVISSWLGTMGCGLPGAMAAKIAYPDRQAVAITGDGGFQMVMHDFLTAVQYDLPIVVFVLNNQEISFIKYEQQAAGELEYAIGLKDMDFAKFAEICGGVGFTLTDPKKIEQVISKALEQDKPTIVNVYVDPDAAPLPGKITNDEAKNFGKWAYRSITEDKKLDPDDIPSIKTSLRRFL